MFVYEKDEFRFYLQRRRTDLKLSRAFVAEIAGINESTIYRVEMGITDVTLDLLYSLSKPLEVDLIKEISNYQFSQLEEYNKVISNIEWILNSFDFKSLKEPIKKLYLLAEKIENEYYANHIIRYCKYIEGCYFSKTNITEQDTSINTYLDLLNINQNDLTNKNIYKLKIRNALDLRILMAIGIYFKNKKEYEKSKLVLEKCYNAEVVDIFIFPMICNNLANVYHILDNMESVLDVADAGIEHCKANNIHESLHLLYYRKGTSKYYLGHNDYSKYFLIALGICDAFNYAVAKDKLISILKRNYDFNYI